jgi:hypothetical protein
MKAVHPEPCPRCGHLTFNWIYRQSRIWLRCENCGFDDLVSNVPVAGSHVYTDSRTAAAQPAKPTS